jgi:N-6 DNA Methylase
MELVSAADEGCDQCDWIALSSPAPGSNFTMLVERIAHDVRRAVDLALEDIESVQEYREVFAPRFGHLGFTPDGSEEPVAAARALVATWLSAYSLGAVAEGDPFFRAELWFRGDGAIPLPRLSHATARPALRNLPSPELVGALLPYLLDPLAPGTRRSVMRRPDESTDRKRRKQQGIYYTPGDVAGYMVEACAGSRSRTCFDPCCGSAVFLRASILARGFPLASLFGTDVDPFAADAAAFALMSAALAHGERWPSPWAAWHAARSRIATVDALLLVPGVSLDPNSQEHRRAEFETLQRALEAGDSPGIAQHQEPLTAIGSLFPPLAAGPDIVVSNPPYTVLGIRPPFDPVQSGFTSLRAGPARRTTRVEGLFVELAWRLLSKRGALSIVLPLSAATGSQPEYAALRGAMRDLDGAWDISFFDRAPDALFGDDVKTRNTIFTFRRGRDRALRTTGLLRWTSWTRRSFLSSIEFARVDWDTTGCIPKIGSSEEAELLAALRKLPSCLAAGAISMKTVCPGRTELGLAHAVLVGPTAYNWLACARDLGAFEQYGHTSASGLTALVFPRADLADAALAVVASRITFWLWRVEGDGFHVTRSFLRDLPFAIHFLPDDKLAELAAAGRDLWNAMRRDPVVSVNKGRRTVAFSALVAADRLDQVDSSLAHVFGLENELAAHSVRAWHENLIVVDFERRASRPLLAKGQTCAA